MASDYIVSILRQTAEAEGFLYIIERHTLSEAADEIERLRAQLAAAEAARDEARGEIADMNETYRHIMDEKCAADERHCTCVPLLRAKLAAAHDAHAARDVLIEELTKKLAAAEARCKQVEEEAIRKISERDARIKRLEKGLFDLGRHEGYREINNGTSTIGMFVKLLLNRSE